MNTQPEKPIVLRQETWQFLLTELNAFSDTQLFHHAGELGYAVDESQNRSQIISVISNRPSAFLLHFGILQRAKLLQNTIIQLPEDTEYLIDENVALSLAKGDEVVNLRRLDGQEVTMTRSRIEDALSQQCEFDQKEEDS